MASIKMICFCFIIELVLIQSVFAAEIVATIDLNQQFARLHIDNDKVCPYYSFEILISSKNDDKLFYPLKLLSGSRSEQAFLDKNKSYTVDDLEKALNAGKERVYPLRLHKECKFDSNTILTLQITEQNRNNRIVPLLGPQSRKILEYLGKDLEEKERDCGDFVQAIAVAPSAASELNADNLFQNRDQDHLFKPGDVIALYDMIDNCDQITFKHFALALGDGLYLSKFGRGGNLGVMRLQDMRSVWGGLHFAKLNDSVMPHLKAFY